MRLSGYRIMWLFCYFDLPTETKTHRKAYAKFRKHLLKDGFLMHQFSVYIRHCTSYEATEAHLKKVERYLPKYGKVSLLTITDKQFENIKNYFCREHSPPPGAPQQLEFF